VDELNINNEEILNAVVELIVDKALSEQSYSATYAQTCHHLKGLMVSSQSSKGFVYFHKLLLKRCQMEFQNGHCKSELLKEKENDVSAAQEESLEYFFFGVRIEQLCEYGVQHGRLRLVKVVIREGERQQLKVDLEQTRHKARVRLLGTVRFIGELFKLRMISGAIIPTCVVKLIKDECEESLECLCKLLSIVGKDLDTETERNNWVPCRKDEGPKTIKQLHQEVKLAEEREQPQSRNKQTTMQQRDYPKTGRTLIRAPLALRLRTSVPRTKKKSVNDKIEEWIPNTLNDRQRSSEGFVRALMRAVCQSVIVNCGIYTLNTYELLDRVSLLKKYITDNQKQLVALNVLQQLVVHIDQPDGECPIYPPRRSRLC
ncbi:Eukaryotic translation initiation factor 4 gamma 1, partial [Takifugu flavidus]